MRKSSIGSRTRGAREAAEKTQQDVAEALGVKRETVAQWENGTRQIKAEALAGLAEYLSVSADYLLGLSKVKFHASEAAIYSIGYGDGMKFVTERVIGLYNDERTKAL